MSDTPYPYTFFTSGQLDVLTGIYDAARIAAVGEFTSNLRGILSDTTGPESTSRTLQHRTIPARVASLLAQWWPFTFAAVTGIGEANLGDLSRPQGGYPSPYNFPNSLTPPTVWVYRLWAGLNFSGEYTASGDTFWGDSASRAFGAIAVCAANYARKIGAGTGSGGRFSSVTETAQRNVYRLYFPRPLFCCTNPELMPALAYANAGEALADYSARVLSGEITI